MKFLSLVLKVVLFSFPLFLVGGVDGHAVLIYKQAEIVDVDALLNLQKAVLDEDRAKLVIFPSLDLARAKLAQDIHQRRIFFAEESETGEALGMIKLYRVQEDNAPELLESEIRAIGQERKFLFRDQFLVSHLLERGSYLETRKRQFDQTLEYEKRLKSVFFYYGSALVQPRLRGQGINTRLLRYGFSELYASLLRAGENRFEISLELLFGQVDLNSGSEGMIYEFSRFCHSFFDPSPRDEFRVQRFGYESIKPELFLNSDGSIGVSFPRQNRGVGSVVVCEFKAEAR